jgi:hypothetical protein
LGGEVGGVLVAGGGVLVAVLAGGVVVLGADVEGGVFPAGGVLVPAAVVALGADLESALGAVLAFLSPGLPAGGGVVVPAGGVVVAPGVAALTFFGLPKSSSVVSGRISVTIPAAIVLPPYLKANLDPLVIVIGKLSLALIVRLSPGLAIFTPSGRQISAAVSEVL